MPPKKPKVKLSLKNLPLLPSYFEYIFVHLRQKVRLRPELRPNFLSTLGPNPARAPVEKPGQTYNSGFGSQNNSNKICFAVVLVYFFRN